MQAGASFWGSRGIPGISVAHASPWFSSHPATLVLLGRLCSRASESVGSGGPGSPRAFLRSPLWHPGVAFPKHWEAPGPPRRPGELPAGTLGSSGVPPGDHFGVLPALPEASFCHYLVRFRRVGPRGDFCSTGGARNPVDIGDTCGTWPSHTALTDSRGHPILCVFATHSGRRPPAQLPP